jgi:hypothetical protein
MTVEEALSSGERAFQFQVCNPLCPIMNDVLFHVHGRSNPYHVPVDGRGLRLLNSGFERIVKAALKLIRVKQGRFKRPLFVDHKGNWAAIIGRKEFCQIAKVTDRQLSFERSAMKARGFMDIISVRRDVIAIVLNLDSFYKVRRILKEHEPSDIILFEEDQNVAGNTETILQKDDGDPDIQPSCSIGKCDFPVDFPVAQSSVNQKDSFRVGNLPQSSLEEGQLWATAPVGASSKKTEDKDSRVENFKTGIAAKPEEFNAPEGSNPRQHAICADTPDNHLRPSQNQADDGSVPAWMAKYYGDGENNEADDIFLARAWEAWLDQEGQQIVNLLRDFYNDSDSPGAAEITNGLVQAMQGLRKINGATQLTFERVAEYVERIQEQRSGLSEHPLPDWMTSLTAEKLISRQFWPSVALKLDEIRLATLWPEVSGEARVNLEAIRMETFDFMAQLQAGPAVAYKDGKLHPDCLISQIQTSFEIGRSKPWPELFLCAWLHQWPWPALEPVGD